jgi:hypothetical protein
MKINAAAEWKVETMGHLAGQLITGKLCGLAKTAVVLERTFELATHTSEVDMVKGLRPQESQRQ